MKLKRIILCTANGNIVAVNESIKGIYEVLEVGDMLTSDQIHQGLYGYTSLPMVYRVALDKQKYWKVISPPGVKDTDIVFEAYMVSNAYLYIEKMKNLYKRSKTNKALKKKLIFISVVVGILLANVFYGFYLLATISFEDEIVSIPGQRKGERMIDPTEGIFDLGRENNQKKADYLLKKADSIKGRYND